MADSVRIHYQILNRDIITLEENKSLVLKKKKSISNKVCLQHAFKDTIQTKLINSYSSLVLAI